MIAENLVIYKNEILRCEGDNVVDNFNYKVYDEAELYEEYKKLTNTELVFILGFYQKSALQKNKKRENMIRKIIDIETSPENFSVVSKRKTLWYYYKCLKNEKAFSKYIIEI